MILNKFKIIYEKFLTVNQKLVGFTTLEDKLKIDIDSIGKIRKKFLNTVDKEVGNYLDYKSFFVPMVQEEDKSGLGKRFLSGKSDAEQQKSRYIMFTANVSKAPFDNLICFLSPIKMSGGFSKIYLEEYTYSTVVPFPCDSIVFYVEKRGSFKGQKGFFVFPSKPDYPIMTREMLMDSDTESSLGFTLGQALQTLRMQLQMSKDVKALMKQRAQSYVSDYLNTSESLPNLIKKLNAIYEAKKIGMKISNDVGVTTILIPNGGNTIIQIGDFKLNPKQAFEVLSELTINLKSAYEAHQQATSPNPSSVGTTNNFCVSCGVQRENPNTKFCTGCGAPFP